jgi:gliding motility-associated-like protein
LKNKALYIVIFILFAVPAWAQQNSTCVNNIELADSIVCVGTVVNPTACYSNQTGASDYNFGDDLNDTVNTRNITQHIYQSKGIFSIKQIFKPDGGTSLTTRRYIYVLDTIKPNVEITYCDNNEVAIFIRDNDAARYGISSFDGNRNATVFYDKYRIDFGDGTTLEAFSNDTSFIHRYNDVTQDYTIKVRGHYNIAACGGEFTQTISPGKPFTAPTSVSLKVLDQSANGSIEYTYSGSDYLSYKLQQKTGTDAYQPVDTINNPPAGEQTNTLSNLNTAGNIYCYKLSTINNCNPANTPESDEICTTILNATVDAAAGVVNLEWPIYPLLAPAANNLRYQLYRDNTLLTEIYQTNTITYTDSTVACGQTYSYRLEVVYEGQYGLLRSISATQTVTAESTRPLKNVEGFYSTIENNQVVVRWNNPEGIILKNFTINRNSSAIASIKDTIYIDSTANLSATNCYTLSYEDSCGNKSAVTPQSCPVRLTAQNSGRYMNDLQWTPYIGWQNGVSRYIIEYLDHDNNIYNSIPLLTQTDYTDDKIDPEQQVLRYRIKAEPNDFTLPPSYSNIAEIKQRARLIFPNAFNPNGHPENQFFRPKGRYIAAYDLQVFNRWGELVYQTYDFGSPGWDGTFRGKPAPEDVYVYKVVARDETGERIELTGTVMLIRTH